MFRSFLRPSVVHVALVCIVVAGIYWHTRYAPFTFDDGMHHVENFITKDLGYFADPDRVRTSPVSALTKAQFETRFLGYLSFALNYRFDGLAVTGYHLVNIAIHLLNCLIVMFVVRRLFTTPRMSNDDAGGERIRELMPLWTALFFAVHPVQTQAVTYISQRFTSLAALFYLLAVLLYLCFRFAAPGVRRSALYGGALAATIAAMKTKEISFTLPLSLVMIEFLFFEGNKRMRAFVLLPFVLCMAIIPLAVLKAAAGSQADADMVTAATNLSNFTGVSSYDYMITQLRVLITYLRLFLFPAGQNIDYDYPLYTSLAEPEILASLALLAGLFAAAVFGVTARRTRGRPRILLASFGLLWFFVTISVESSVIPLDDLIFEHRLYLPLFGLAIAGLSAVDQAVAWWTSAGGGSAAPANGIFAVIVLLLAVATFQRNAIWRSDVTLWEDAARKSPNKARPHLNLGYATHYSDPDRALAAYRRAHELNPALGAIVFINEGDILFTKKEYGGAKKSFAKALAVSPFREKRPFVKAVMRLGDIAVREGDFATAKKWYGQVLETPHFNAEARFNLGLVSENEGDVIEAIRQFEMFLRTAPPELGSFRTTAEARLRALRTRSDETGRNTAAKPINGSK